MLARHRLAVVDQNTASHDYSALIVASLCQIEVKGHSRLAFLPEDWRQPRETTELNKSLELTEAQNLIDSRLALQRPVPVALFGVPGEAVALALDLQPIAMATWRPARTGYKTAQPVGPQLLWARSASSRTPGVSRHDMTKPPTATSASSTSSQSACGCANLSTLPMSRTFRTVRSNLRSSIC